MLQVLALSYFYSEKNPLFHNVNLSWHHELCGLVGPNGCGKSTVLRLLSGELLPQEGRVLRDEREIVFLRQSQQDEDAPLMSLWGAYREVFEASLRIKSHGGDASDWDLMEGEWETVAEFEKSLDEWVNIASWNAPISSLNPGNLQRIQLALAFARPRALLLLDEPSNHLDGEGRKLLRDALRLHRGGAIIASHDRELLNGVDRILDLRSMPPRDYRGNYEVYKGERETSERARIATREALDREYRKSKKEAQRLKQEREQRQAHANKTKDKLGVPRIILGMMKRNAENTAARLNAQQSDKLNRLKEQREAHSIDDLRKDPLLLDIKGSKKKGSTFLLSVDRVNHHYGTNPQLWKNPLTFHLEEGERIAVAGNNGSGKSTLLAILEGKISPAEGRVMSRCRSLASIDQTLAILAKGESLASSWQGEMYLPIDSDRRTIAARFGLKGDLVNKPFEELSGGQRMRAALVLLATRSVRPDLVILDEASNHLDIDTLKSLSDTLRDLNCALIVVSHDSSFLEELGIDNILPLL